MATIAVTKSNIETKVLTSEKVILLEFWAKWCTSCRDMYSILDEVANERPDVLIGKVNVDYEPDYIEENVSTKVVKIIQSYTGIVDKMVWRKY